MKKIKRFKQLGVVMLGAYVISGCPSPTVSNLLTNNSPISAEAVAQETTEEAATVPAEERMVAFDVCADVSDWQRPSEADQAKQLSSDPRYGEALAVNSPLKRASTQFWNHQVVSFTSYGLSARMEPVNLSGVWTAADELWGCYEPETTVAINEGDRAETWLLNQRITDLQWTGDRYLMTVEPAATGMQVVQFDRTEELANLPLEVVTTNGTAVETVSGDWQ